MSVKPAYKITGQIIDRKQRQGIVGLRIYAWDKDILTRDELLGSAVTDSEGRFEIAFEWPRVRTLWTLWEDIIDWCPDLYFEVRYRGKPISDFDVFYSDMAQPFPSDSARWNVPGNAMSIRVELDDPAPKKPTEIYTIKGAVLSNINGKGIERLRIEAWDKDALIDDSLGAAVTDNEGQFELEFDGRYYQEICFDRRPDIYFKVYSGKGLILSTEDSVLWNVDQWPRQVAISVNLLPGKVDGPTPPSMLSVRGRVAKAEGSPLAGLQMVALDRDGRGGKNNDERLLGKTYTDNRGYYAIRYTIDQLVSPAKGSADLVVRVYGDQSKEPLASSPLILNALEEEIINFSVGEEAYRGYSEYQAVAERLQPFLEGLEKSDLSRQDIACFSNQTDLTVEQVQLYFESEKHSRRAGLDAGIIYSLYRGGFPYSFAALTVQSPDTLRASMKRAQEMNIIAPIDEATIAKAIESLQTLGVQELLDTQSPAQVHAAKLLDIADLSASEKSAVLKVYSVSPQPSEKFWGDLQQASVVDEAKLSLLRQTFELNALSLDHLPLVEKLGEHIGDGSLKVLAVKDPDGWNDFLKQEEVDAPEQIPGKTAEEKRSNYGLILARIMEDNYPTTAVAGRWIQDQTLDREVAAFFGTNPDFSFESWSINDYLKKYPSALDGVEDKKTATFKLQAVQNLHRIAPRFERLGTVKALWQDKLYSAHMIKRMGEEKFVEKYEKTIGKPQAHLVYANAEKVAGFAPVQGL